MNFPKGLTGAIMLAMLTVGCLSASGGNSSNIPLKDFFGLKPTVQIEWPNMVLTVPTNYPSSIAYVLPKVKVDGDSILIEAKYILRQKPATTTFNLSKLGIKKEKVSSAKAYWLNPDGTKNQLEIELKQASQK